ncbi:DmsC/YnfH family molybdoenzyme membrane anchor subunit [Enterobacter sp. ECC-175]|uniref:dimethyl sulfoxide reductase anchor subunit family protein n=1 Tax=unclassified Enterobacter TaxID=2608935 RepID=UPI000D483B4F|nr:DmsC/YnfH family molybdoenzyme membrane anchor subunit [Enterobacter sp. RIT 418]RAU35598.1 hydrogenase [Enterobacter sp. RIT 418]
MEKYELPLVIFTVLSQMSVGMTLLLTWRTLRGELEGNRIHWLITGLILGVASIAAILHLAHPEHAYNALINLKHAWLSREILGATLYGGTIGLAFLTKGNKGAALLASLFGILLVVVQGMTYAAPAMQAIANGITMMLFFATVWVMGCAAAPLLRLNASGCALRNGVLVLMALMIAAPVMWLSGGTIMKMTAHAWLSSPLYLGSLACCAVGCALTMMRQPMQKAVFAILLVGLVLSRLTFFGDTVSTIVNIGHLY